MAHHFKRHLKYIGYGGTGKQVRDILHVDDLCRLLVDQIRDFNCWDGWSGNVAGGLENSVSLQELTAICQEVTGNQIQCASESKNRPSDLRLFIADCRKLQKRLVRTDEEQGTRNKERTTTDFNSQLSVLSDLTVYPLFADCCIEA
jgi:UDP-glucose 4-epimerase